MRTLIVYSTRDAAGVNIGARLLKLYPFLESSRNGEGLPVYALDDILLTSTGEETVHASHVEGWFDVDLIVFASKHKSASGKPCLTVHPPGNLGESAEVGGLPRKICVTPAFRMKAALMGLYAQARDMGLLENYGVSMECTHHGDYLERTPCFYIEIGSREENWGDDAAALAVARAIVGSLGEVGGWRPAIGLGGPHYGERFTRVMLQSDVAVGHVASKYSVPYLDGEMVRMMVERTIPRPELALLDWKGLGGLRGRMISILEDLGMRWMRLRGGLGALPPRDPSSS